MRENEAMRVFLYALAVVFVGFQINLVQGALRAIGRYAKSIIVFYAINLLEGISTATALVLFGAPPTTIAALMVVSRLVALAVSITMLRHYAPWIRHGVAQARTSDIWRLLLPSVAMLGIPSGNAMMMQGFTLILSHTLGPAAVALFSTTRTMTRFVLQVISLFSWSSWPEISRQHGAGRTDRLSAFLTHGTQLAAVLALGYAIFAIGGGPLIIKLWTAGRIEADHTLVAILMIGAVAITFRAFPDTLIFATNRHVGYSTWYLLVCFSATAASYPASVGFGVVGASAAVAAAEIVLLAISMTRALKQIGEGLAPIRRMFTTRPPIDRLISRH